MPESPDGGSSGGFVQICNRIRVTTFKKRPVPCGIQSLLPFQRIDKFRTQLDVSSGGRDGEGRARP